jgi:hypothetical protein
MMDVSSPRAGRRANTSEIAPAADSPPARRSDASSTRRRPASSPLQARNTDSSTLPLPSSTGSSPRHPHSPHHAPHPDGFDPLQTLSTRGGARDPSSPRLPSSTGSSPHNPFHRDTFDPHQPLSSFGGTGRLGPRAALSRAASEGSADPLVTRSRAASGSAPELAPASERAASEALAAPGPSTLQRIGRSLDMHGLLTHANDRQFLAEVAPHAHHLKASLCEMKDSLGNLQGVPPKLQAQLRRRLDQAIAATDALLKDQPFASRLAKGAAMFALLSPLPLALPFLTQPKQLQYAALTIAHYSKTLVGMAGLVSRPKTDNAQWMAHFNERHLTAFLPAALTIGPVLAQPDLVSNPAFYAPTGIALTAAAFASAYPEKVKDLLRSAAHALRGKPGEEEPISADLRNTIQQRLRDILPAEQALTRARDGLGPRGLSLSDSTNAQVSAAKGSVDDLLKAVGTLAHNLEAVAVGPGQEAGDPRARRHDPDRTAKVALAAFSAAATFGAAAMVYPDTVGVADFASDAVFVTSLMASIAMDPAQSKQDSLAKFKSMVGLSLLSVGFLGANKIAPFLGEDMAGMVAGTAAIVGANLVLPGPVGQAAGQLIEAGADIGAKIYDRIRASLGGATAAADADALSDLSPVGSAAGGGPLEAAAAGPSGSPMAIANAAFELEQPGT